MAYQHLEPSRRFYTPYYSERSTAMGIRLHVTDAQSILPPKGAMRQINNSGSVDYYEESSEEEVNLWLRKIGRYAACHALHRSEVRNPKQCVLLDLPSGYRLYTHKKGHKDDPRRDHYLMGSRYVHQFRSPAEFFLHFYWLLAGMPMDSVGLPDCQCCYCSETPQGEISQRYSKYTVRRSLDGTDPAKKKAHEHEKIMQPATVKKLRTMRTTRPPSPPIVFKDYTTLQR